MSKSINIVLLVLIAISFLSLSAHAAEKGVLNAGDIAQAHTVTFDPQQHSAVIVTKCAYGSNGEHCNEAPTATADSEPLPKLEFQCEIDLEKPIEFFDTENAFQFEGAQNFEYNFSQYYIPYKQGEISGQNHMIVPVDLDDYAFIIKQRWHNSNQYNQGYIILNTPPNLTEKFDITCQEIEL